MLRPRLKHVPKNCPHCRPVFRDKKGQPYLDSDPVVQRLLQMFNDQTDEVKAAWHRVQVHELQDFDDLELIKPLVAEMDAAFNNIVPLRPRTS